MSIRSLITVAVTLLLGVGIGIFTSRLIQRYLSVESTLSEGVVQQMVDQLDLDPEQEREARKILKTQYNDVRELYREAGPKFREFQGLLHEDIRKVLTPKQRRRFDRMYGRHLAPEKQFSPRPLPDRRQD